MSDATLSRVGWGVFVVAVATVLGWAEMVRRAAPPPRFSGEIKDGVRFGLTEAKRKQIFLALTKGEPADRTDAERRKDDNFNGNRDDWFHRNEIKRIATACAPFGIGTWTCWLILDEGFHAHWPVEPGVTIYHDERPLSPTTRPLAQRRVIVAAPPAPPAPPSPTPPPGPPAPPSPGPPPAPVKK